MTLAQKLSQYSLSLNYAALPREAVCETKRRVLDSLGCALAALNTVPGKAAREAAKAGTGSATVLGTRQKTSVSLAAFAGGTFIRYWDYNDTYLSKEPAHPSDNLGALLAAAEAGGKSGKDLIVAAVLAYEIQCRFCDGASLRARGWDHVTYGTFSVAAGVGKLLGLSRKELEHALGIAGISGMAMRQTRVGEISHWKASAFANAAKNAVFACELARLGVTGPAPIFEGEKAFFKLVSGPLALVRLGGHQAPFKILETHIKYYPVEYHAQAAVEAALRLRARLKNLNQIQKIEVATYDAALDIIARGPEKWRPRSRETADHSLPYVIARALLDGKMGLEQFSQKKINDARIQSLMKKIEIRADQKMTQAYPAALPIRIRVREASHGEPIEEVVETPRGHYKNPMTDREVEEKFIRLASKVLSTAKQSRIIDICRNLERQKNLDELMKNLAL